MRRILAMAAMACMAGGAPAAFGAGDGPASAWDAGSRVSEQETNAFYGMRALGRAESRLTGTTLEGSPGAEDLIDRNRDQGRAEAWRIPETLGGGEADGRAFGESTYKGHICSVAQLKRDC